jgi:hypothetical protein
MQYIQFEKYDVLTGMNGDRRMSMDEKGRTDGIGQMDVDKHRTKVDGRRWTEGAEQTELDGWMLMNVGRKLMDVGWNYDRRR